MYAIQFVGFLVFLCLAVYVLAKDEKDQLNRSCAGLFLCFSEWNYCLMYAHDPHQTKVLAELFYSIGAIGWVGFASCSFWFILVFTRQTDWLKNWWLRLGMIFLPVWFIGLQWSGLLAADYTLLPWGWEYVWSDSIWSLLFYCYLLTFLVYGLFLIYRFSQKAISQQEKQQSKILLYSGVVSFVLAFTVDVILPRLQISVIPNIAPVLVLIYAFGVVYAIRKYYFTLSPSEIEARAANEWRATFDSIPDLIYVIDQNYKFVKLNKAALDFFKMKPEELIGKKRCFEIVHKTGRPWPNCAAEKTMHDKLSYSEEVDDPAIGIPLLVSTSPILNSQGDLVGVVHLAKDISERKKNERLLKKAFDELEQKVTERTRELNQKLIDLEQFRKVTIDREFRMEELRKEIERLKLEKEPGK